MKSAAERHVSIRTIYYTSFSRLTDLCNIKLTGGTSTAILTAPLSVGLALVFEFDFFDQTTLS